MDEANLKGNVNKINERVKNQIKYFSVLELEFEKTISPSASFHAAHVVEYTNLKRADHSNPIIIANSY